MRTGDLQWINLSAMCQSVGFNATLESDPDTGLSKFVIQIEHGVVQTLSQLLQAARDAQEAVNVSLSDPSLKLRAFPLEEIGIANEGFVPVTRSIIGYYELNSSSNIVGVCGE